MTSGRSLPPLVLHPNEEKELTQMSRSRSLPAALVKRATIILLAAKGMSNIAIAKEIQMNNVTVGIWRKRFLAQRLPGLYDEPRPGAPRTYSDDKIAELIKRTLQTQPPDATHWTCRSTAKATGISKSHVQRIWSAFAIQPHKQKQFKLSTDPFFVDKVRDIVGLYLNPPDKAMVLCVDEKSQIQSLERTQPMLPMGLGYAEGVTHDYKRHGTTTLFAALNIDTGTVMAQCKPKHRHQEFIQFLNYIDKQIPEDLDVHLIVDNYATHKHAKVRQWLATRSRYHVHYTPTYSSWLNQVEIWFNIITQKTIRRSSTRCVKQLVEKINSFVENYNADPKPFKWAATAEYIFSKINRLCESISGTQH